MAAMSSAKTFLFALLHAACLRPTLTTSQSATLLDQEHSTMNKETVQSQSLPQEEESSAIDVPWNRSDFLANAADRYLLRSAGCDDDSFDELAYHSSVNSGKDVLVINGFNARSKNTDRENSLDIDIIGADISTDSIAISTNDEVLIEQEDSDFHLLLATTPPRRAPSILRNDIDHDRVDLQTIHDENNEALLGIMSDRSSSTTKENRKDFFAFDVDVENADPNILPNDSPESQEATRCIDINFKRNHVGSNMTSASPPSVIEPKVSRYCHIQCSATATGFSEAASSGGADESSVNDFQMKAGHEKEVDRKYVMQEGVTKKNPSCKKADSISTVLSRNNSKTRSEEESSDENSIYSAEKSTGGVDSRTHRRKSRDQPKASGPKNQHFKRLSISSDEVQEEATLEAKDFSSFAHREGTASTDVERESSEGEDYTRDINNDKVGTTSENSVSTPAVDDQASARKMITNLQKQMRQLEDENATLRQYVNKLLQTNQTQEHTISILQNGFPKDATNHKIEVNNNNTSSNNNTTICDSKKQVMELMGKVAELEIMHHDTKLELEKERKTREKEAADREELREALREAEMALEIVSVRVWQK
mmetsp:Transcript_3768/g.7994  ORF Transcript_3768/g.7994 Transcript_3768/m.7994 type:complete len:596 (-) Transcript_3768:117-1904(-)